MEKKTAILLELVSVTFWWKLAEHLDVGGTFGAVGLLCGMLISCIVALITLGFSARALWRLPWGQRAFWGLFALMMGGFVGILFFVLYVDIFWRWLNRAT
jgi:hypothetical protein